MAAGVADAIELPFEHISMGCIKDVNTLIGHSSTYIGSRPGIFVELLRKMKAKNGVILLDEVDKISHSAENGSITATLLHILDRTQNNKFRDMYMPEITIDLSNVFFILALNDEQLLDPILRDRLCIIKIDGYSESEKIDIGMNYIVPKTLEDLCFSHKDISIPKDIMQYIIEKTCKNDPGVRQLEKAIGKIFERLNVLKHLKTAKKKQKLSYEIDNLKFPIKINKDHVNILLMEIKIQKVDKNTT